jgi:hypothetical protein
MAKPKPAKSGAIQDMVWSDITAPGELWVANGDHWELMTDPMRRRLRDQLEAGELDKLSFQAVTFRAEYPNANYLRFRDSDLPAFADSFAGVPFLRNHDLRDIGSRGGTVRASALDDNAFLQEIDLTVPRDIEAFLNGQIDRFSISWNSRAITCSVCNQDWLSAACSHWPGRKYKVKDEGGEESERLCELIFESPTGREVSAVNAPAVQGTGVRGLLEMLCDSKTAILGLAVADPALGAGDEEESEQSQSTAAPEAARLEETTGEVEAMSEKVEQVAQAVEAPKPAPAISEGDFAKLRQSVEAEMREQLLAEYAKIEAQKGKIFTELMEQVREERAIVEFSELVTGEGRYALPVKADALAEMLKALDKPAREQWTALLSAVHQHGTVDFTEHGTAKGGAPKQLDAEMGKALKRFVKGGGAVEMFFEANELGDPKGYDLTEWGV